MLTTFDSNFFSLYRYTFLFICLFYLNISHVRQKWGIIHGGFRTSLLQIALLNFWVIVGARRKETNNDEEETAAHKGAEEDPGPEAVPTDQKHRRNEHIEESFALDVLQELKVKLNEFEVTEGEHQNETEKSNKGEKDILWCHGVDRKLERKKVFFIMQFGGHRNS